MQRPIQVTGKKRKRAESIIVQDNQKKRKRAERILVQVKGIWVPTIESIRCFSRRSLNEFIKCIREIFFFRNSTTSTGSNVAECKETMKLMMEEIFEKDESNILVFKDGYSEWVTQLNRYIADMKGIIKQAIEKKAIVCEEDQIQVLEKELSAIDSIINACESSEEEEEEKSPAGKTISQIQMDHPKAQETIEFMKPIQTADEDDLDQYLSHDSSFPSDDDLDDIIVGEDKEDQDQ